MTSIGIGIGIPKFSFEGAGGGEGPYIADAVVFDGVNDYMTNASPSGLSDTKVGIMSFWYFKQTDSTDQTLICGTNTYPRLRFEGNQTEINFRDNVGGVLEDQFGNFQIADGWTHHLIAWDVGNAVYEYYVDDVDQAQSADNLNDRPIDWTRTAYKFGAKESDATEKADGYISDFYLNTDEYVDISVEANRRKFIDASGKPVDLGSDGSTPTGNQPAFFFTGNASTFNNVGYAGTFTLTGELTNAPTSPSD